MPFFLPTDAVVSGEAAIGTVYNMHGKIFSLL